MHKLVILIEQQVDRNMFDTLWPQFLHWVEKMPGLVRESSSETVKFLFGRTYYMKMHELYFETLKDAENAMASEPGQAAGKLLQKISRGHMTLFLAEHKEDTLENIQEYQQENDQTE
jgi:uncharacterized protein (TIGR02118 family)